MGTVTGFTAARMLVIENSTIVDGEVQGDNLILQTRDGTNIDAGSVRGPQGIQGEMGPGVLVPGIISMYGGDIPPGGYLLCDGAAVSRTQYAALFSKISTIWGAGDGSTTFNLPNLQQRFPVGRGTATYADVLGEGGGSKDAVLLQHTHDNGHTHNTSNHAHSFDHGHGASSDWASNNHTHTLPDHSHPASENTGGGGYPYRQPSDPGAGDAYDVVVSRPERMVILYWRPYPATLGAGRIETEGHSSNHFHTITVATLYGTATGQAGAQTLTHAGATGQPIVSPPAVPAGTDKNLPPYLVVNFIIKT